MPYLLGETRSERDSNPRGGFPHQPHFQVSGAGCKAGHLRAPRIQDPVAEGTTRQAKAPPLGLDLRAQRPAVERNSHAKQPGASSLRLRSACFEWLRRHLLAVRPSPGK